MPFFPHELRNTSTVQYLGFHSASAIFSMGADKSRLGLQSLFIGTFLQLALFPNSIFKFSVLKLTNQEKLKNCQSKNKHRPRSLPASSKSEAFMSRSYISFSLSQTFQALGSSVIKPVIKSVFLSLSSSEKKKKIHSYYSSNECC